MRTPILLIFSAIAIAAPGGPDVQQLMDNGHWKRARDVAEADFKAHPNDARAAYVLARVRHEFERLDEAVKLAETAVRLDPKVSQYHRELGEACADAAGKLSFFKQISYGRRIHGEFDAALAIAPKDPDNLMDQVQYFMEAPGVIGGDKKKAAEIANEMVKIDAAHGYLALAYVAQKQKEDGKLQGLYQKAVEANPKNYGARLSLIGRYLNTQHPNLSAAEQHIRAALDLNPDRIDGYRLLAYTLVLEKRYDDVAKVIARAEAAIPDDLSPNVSAARAFLRDGAELSKAESYLQKYIAQTKEPEANAASLEGAHRVLALVYEKEGRKPDAVNELQTALRINPSFEPAKKDLKRLK